MLQTSIKMSEFCREVPHYSTSHRTLTDQNHGNGGKRAKKNTRRGWTWSRKVLEIAYMT